MSTTDLANYTTALQDSCRFVRFSAGEWRGKPAVYDAETLLFAPFKTEQTRALAAALLNESPDKVNAYFWEK